MVWTVNLPDHMMEVCAAFYQRRLLVKQSFVGGAVGSQCNYHGRNEHMAGSSLGFTRSALELNLYLLQLLTPFPLLVDYEKTRSQYGRSFLWTTFR